MTMDGFSYNIDYPQQLAYLIRIKYDLFALHWNLWDVILAPTTKNIASLGLNIIAQNYLEFGNSLFLVG